MVCYKGGVGVLLIPKCASQSMGTVKGILNAKTEEDVPKVVHAFIRDPIDRLYSAFAFMDAAPPGMYEYMNRRATWEEFVDTIIQSGLIDEHWEPQADVVARLGRPVILHLFENISTEFPFEGLEWTNKRTRHFEADLSYREDELKEYYAGDYQLREEAGWKKLSQAS